MRGSPQRGRWRYHRRSGIFHFDLPSTGKRGDQGRPQRAGAGGQGEQINEVADARLEALLVPFRPRVWAKWTPPACTRFSHWFSPAAQYRKALAPKPEFVEAHNNLGNALQTHRQLSEAIASYRQALVFRPDFAAA